MIRLRLALLLCTPITAVFAQPTSATFRPSLIETIAASYSYSGAADVARGPALGEVSAHHTEASLGGRLPLATATFFNYGIAATVNELNADAALPLPDRLGEFTLNLGVTQRFSPQWSGSLFLRPGFYSDLESFSSDTFNVPVFALVTYARSADLVWMFGAGANPFSERVALPVVGVRWKFAPSWMLNLGFPRLGVSWEVDSQLTLRAGLSVQGGSYRITEDLGVPAPGIGRLANTYLQYREIRLGVGADWKMTGKFSLVAEAGVMTDRRFEYYDRDYTLNGEAAPYLTLGLQSRF